MTTKTVLVTGASRGLGAATAEILGTMHVNLILNARSKAGLQELVRPIDPEGSPWLVGLLRGKSRSEPFHTRIGGRGA